MHMDVEVGAVAAMVVQAPLFLVMEDQEACMVVGQVMVAVVVTILMQGRSCLNRSCLQVSLSSANAFL